MTLKWVQQRTRDGEMQKWSLVHKESRIIVLDMWFSACANQKQNSRLRRKVQAAYECYFQSVWFDALKFF